MAKSEGYPILAKIKGVASHSHEPAKFTTAPVPAIQKLLSANGLEVANIDIWEINEAFAVVPMAAAHELGLDAERLNVRGGACAVGHPIGASGARIIVTLLHAMEASKAHTGVAALCIGGGEGTALTLHRSG